jgi:hypothetical protein
LRFGGSDDIVADYAISSILTVKKIVTSGKSGVKPREFEGRALNKSKAQF